MEKEKVISIIVISLSIVILLTIMGLGKTLGRGIASHQAYIKEHFPVIDSTSEKGRLLESISALELKNLRDQGVLITFVVIISSLVMFTTIKLTNRYVVID